MENFNKSKSIILCARQRSGTNLLRKAIETTEQCTNYAEIFNDNYFKIKEHSFFNYKLNLLKKDVNLSFPSAKNQYKIFNEYFNFLQMESKLPFHIIDIKYNSWHHFNSVWHSIPEMPQLLKWVVKREIPIIHIIRKNLLHQYISTTLAKQTGKYHFKSSGNELQNAVIKINTEHCKKSMRIIDEEGKKFRNWLNNYPNYYSINYKEIVSENKFSNKINDLIKQVTKGEIVDLGEPPLKKVIKNPFEHIENKEELIKSLKGTAFEVFI